MRVLHVAETVDGGIDTYLATLFDSSEYKSNYSHVYVLSPKDYKNCTSYITPRKRGLFSLYVIFIRSFFLLLTKRPDVIHLHSTLSGLVVRVWYPIFYRRTKFIYYSHGWYFNTGKKYSGFFKYIEKWLSKFCDLIINISEDEHKSAIDIGIPKNKMKVILNGVRPKIISKAFIHQSAFSHPIKDQLKIIFVGRLDEQKGIDILLEALKLLEIKDHTKVMVMIVGSSVLKDSRNFIEEINIMSNIEYINWVDNEEIDNYISLADVMVIPSRWEGFGLVAAEAFRNGVPVIAAKVGALKHIIVDGINGWHFKPDDPDDLCKVIKKVSKLFLNKSYFDQISASSLDDYKKHYTSNRMIKETLRAYKYTKSEVCD